MASLIPRRRRQGRGFNPNRLTASGARVTRRDGEKVRRSIQPWQQQAFYYYDKLGVIKYAAQFYSRLISNVTIFAGEVTEDGDVKPTTNDAAREAVDRIQDPGGGRTNLLGSYGRLMFLAGESIMFVTKDADTGNDQWEMLSCREVRYQDGRWYRLRAPSLGAEEYREAPDDAFEVDDERTGVGYRLWRPHPEFSWLADATMQAVLEDCDELLALTRAVRTRARSRLPNGGLLMIPDELTIVPMEPVGDEDPEEDPFLADFTDALMQPMTDEGAASSVVPYVLRGDGDALAKVRHLQVIDPTLYYPESGLRRECIDRIAIGLDLPPEILTGTGEVTHWTAWSIDESTWKSHGQPLAQQLCDDLTAAYLRPMLMSQRVAGWDRFVVGYDATSVINHPDRSRDAKDLHDRGAIGDEALRDAAGFDEDSAPTEQERIVWISRVARDPGFAVTGIPSRPTAEGATSVDVAAARESSVGDGAKTLPGESSAEVTKGPPPEPTVASANGHGPEAYRVLGAAEAALLRAREMVGNRIANQARRHGREAERLVEGVARAKVAAVLGPERLREFGCGSSADLAAAARPWIVDAVAGCGVDRARADRLARIVEQHLARTLYEDPPPPLPASFVNYAAGLVGAP